MELHEVWNSTEADDTSLRVHPLATLVTSGRVAAQDPFSMSAPEPFAPPLPAGAHPVELLLSTRQSDTRVALARVRFSNAPASRHEMALRERQDLRALRPGHRFGFAVDGGVACFMDAGAEDALLPQELDEMLRELARPARPTWTYATRLGEGPGHRVVVFSSGYGDGFYTPYLGRDAAGHPVELVIDFDCLDLTLPAPPTSPSPRAVELWRELESLMPQLGGGGAPRNRGYEIIQELAASPAADVAPVIDRIWQARAFASDSISDELFRELLSRLLSAPPLLDASLRHLKLSRAESWKLLRRVRQLGPAATEAFREGFPDAHRLVQRKLLSLGIPDPRER